MTIAMAVQRGNNALVYDETGKILCSIGSVDALMGWTSSTVTIRNGNTMRTYNEKGQIIGATSAI